MLPRVGTAVLLVVALLSWKLVVLLVLGKAVAGAWVPLLLVMVMFGVVVMGVVVVVSVVVSVVVVIVSVVVVSVVVVSVVVVSVVVVLAQLPAPSASSSRRVVVAMGLVRGGAGALPCALAARSGPESRNWRFDGGGSFIETPEAGEEAPPRRRPHRGGVPPHRFAPGTGGDGTPQHPVPRSWVPLSPPGWGGTTSSVPKPRVGAERRGSGRESLDPWAGGLGG